MPNTITTSATAMEYSGSGAQVVDPAVTVTGDNVTGTVTAEVLSQTADDELAIDGNVQIPPSISPSVAGGTVQLSCTNATAAEVTAVLQGVTYENTAGDERTGSQRIVRFTVENGEELNEERYIWLRDPFTQVETELWAILEDHSDLSGIIKPIKTSGEAGVSDDAVDTYQAGDLANVRLIPAGNNGQTNLGRASNAGTIGQRYHVVVVSGDLATRRLHNPIKWGVAKALASHLSEHKTNNTPLLGLGPVSDADPGSGIVPQLSWQVLAETDDDEANDRGARGWAALMAIDVTLWVSDAQALV